jgi:hypothetical protein
MTGEPGGPGACLVAEGVVGRGVAGRGATFAARAGFPATDTP